MSEEFSISQIFSIPLEM